MKYLRLTVEPADREIHPVHTIMTERPFVEQVQMLHWNLSDFELPALLFYVVGDATKVADGLDATPEIETFDITRIDDGRFYCFTLGETTDIERTLYATFTRDKLIVLPPLTYDASGGVNFEIMGRPEMLRDTLQRVPDGIDISVERVGEYDTARQTIDAALTSRQREAVLAAMSLGYYETPRKATIVDVAAELDCARSTAAEHLQKAEARIIRTVL
ncbi:DNA-binding protein [Halogeometricum borinquense]|uniref:DNA binding protein n=2 Tax=Halogeometricum borinquense TaxID=60847 RepID=E4NMD6_HALBP|nr:helix-turn-helix domain-containing protein [Halogeometricum borinquense]ADQ67341.1 predicted DNA binding protein [Halogeometricum borinquense DSM 11551]ELY28556.1 DNA binding protein [Halogeometricum borinquense DSM 11551]QIQ76615.1 DNA-binding protein [Halogeometricum borinquense]RYJ13649.1 DNA-binding protein [Halogeometricum borinquense]